MATLLYNATLCAGVRWLHIRECATAAYLPVFDEVDALTSQTVDCIAAVRCLFFRLGYARHRSDIFSFRCFVGWTERVATGRSLLQGVREDRKPKILEN